MASAEQYAAWIVKNEDKKGTPEFNTVAEAYRDAMSSAPKAEQYKPKNFVDDMSFGEKYAAGVGKAVVDTGRGVGQLLRHAMPDSLADSVGLPSQSDIDESRRLDAPLMDTGAGIAGNVTGNLTSLLIPGMAAAKYGEAVPLAGKGIKTLGEWVTMPKGFWRGAAGGGILGATQPVTTDDNRGLNMLIGAAAGGLPIGAYKGVVGAKRFAADHLPTNSALLQLEDKLGGIVPDKAPGVGMTHEERGLPADFVGAPTPRYGNMQDIEPTVAMLSDDPNILKLETNARNRSPQLFMPRDVNNIEAVYKDLDKYALNDATANRAQDALNSTTGPLRESAIDLIKERSTIGTGGNGYGFTEKPKYIKPLSDYLGLISNSPDAGERSLFNLADGYLKNPTPESVYKLRKNISDKLELKPNISLDDASNAVLNNRRIATQINKKIDEGFNESSKFDAGDNLTLKLLADAFPNSVPTPKWDQYLTEYKKGIAPIEEGRTFQNILDKFDKNKPLLGKDVPMITPHGLRSAVENETYKNLGETGWVDKVSPQGRAAINDAVSVMNDLEKAKTGVKATDGSQTASFVTSLLSSAVPKSGMVGTIADYLKNAGIRGGNTILDESLLSPESFQTLLDAYKKRGPTNRKALSEMVNRSFLPTQSLSSYLTQQ